MLRIPGIHVLFFTVLVYTYKLEFTIQYYPNLKPNHEKGTKFRTRKTNPIILALILPKGRRVANTVVGLGFLDTALYLNQYSEDASYVQHGVGPFSLNFRK